SCHVYQAVRAANGTWSAPTRPANADGEDGPPDTDGGTVVYASTRAVDPTHVETDVYYRPVAGSTETQPALPGAQLPSVQLNPHVAGTIISFEAYTPEQGATPPSYRLFAYDTATNILYPFTQTIDLIGQPTLPADLPLSDLTVLPDGRVRVVYTAVQV